MNPKETYFMLDDDLLNFNLEGEEEEQKGVENAVSDDFSPLTTPFCLDTQSSSFPEFDEEELEWISNKDAFPEVEFGILADSPELIVNHESPVSVLDNMSSGKINTLTSCFESLKVPTNYPVRPRSRTQTRRRVGLGEFPIQAPAPAPAPPSQVNVGRRCLHCQADKTPQWRAGPMGPKTLCNACGVRYKSGRLVPEYRPANSPTFSSALHSNSHRKVVEMRKQKQLPPVGGMGG